jgi:hypothetical protein
VRLDQEVDFHCEHAAREALHSYSPRQLLANAALMPFPSPWDTLAITLLMRGEA